MQPPALSEEQRALVLTDGHLFAEACPGAGKTRAIVARFLHRTDAEPRKGIGLVSFTNAAIDEVKARCGDRPDARLAPHFVGTFDRFINQFITRPLYVQRCGKTPRFIESWKDTKHASFRIADMDGLRLPDFELGWFALDGQLRATLREDWIPPKYEQLMTSFAAAHRTALEARATLRCQALVRSGLVSCAASRALAVGHLTQRPTAERIGRLLANRFSEVIIDEVQDCGPEDLLVLRLLRHYGVTLAAVADLDQSIFGFRRADPEGVRAFAQTFDTRLTLNGNYRSSPAVCAMNNSLRFGNREEIACGPNASCPMPVMLLEFKNQDEVAAAVDDLLAVHERSRSEVAFLAHRESDAQRCAGVRNGGDSQSTKGVLGIAWASSVLRPSSSTAAERLRAAVLVEKTLRRIVGIDDEDEHALDERWLRDAAYRLAVTLNPVGSTAKDYASKVRAYVQQMQWPAGITPQPKLGALLKAPREDAWPTVDGASKAFASATIHSVKGREFTTVVVVLPKSLLTDKTKLHALDHWEQRTASEVRRVIYVGASRAQTLLILAAHTDHIDRVVRLLKDDSVPYKLVLLSSS